jgi:hypothetical protein
MAPAALFFGFSWFAALSVASFHCSEAAYLVICNTKLGRQFGCSRNSSHRGILQPERALSPGTLRVLQDLKAASACLFVCFVWPALLSVAGGGAEWSEMFMPVDWPVERPEKWEGMTK